MAIQIREYQEKDIAALIQIWNEVVEDGVAFPQLEPLTVETGTAFFAEQTFTATAYDDETAEVVGLYILHPNNVGRCGNICNASYAVKSSCRGKGIGEQLVRHCIAQGKVCGFGILRSCLQFNW